MIALGLVVPLAVPLVAHADQGDQSRSYRGPTYGTATSQPPTRFGQQSKLWFYDRSWWASMVDPGGTVTRVYELMPDHTWRATVTVLSRGPEDTGDVLAVGGRTYVVSRRTDGVVQFVRLDYDAADREYTATAPTVVTGTGGSAPPTIARDSTGTLWVAYATARGVDVMTSGDDGATWSVPAAIPGPTGSFVRENASVVAFDSSVGVFWSNQAEGRYGFTVHRDGAPTTEWSVENAFTDPNGAGGPMSVKVLDGNPDSVVAAVQSTAGDPVPPGKAPPPGETPLVTVLSRSSDGRWTSAVAGTLRDGLRSPSIAFDATNRTVEVLGQSGGDVQLKAAPLDSLAFPPGRGLPVVAAQGTNLLDVTGSKQPFDAGSGLVALASGRDDLAYHHGEVTVPGVPPPADPPDLTPPLPPAKLDASSGTDTLTISWAAAPDGVRWSAAADQAPVRGYEVYRDDVLLGTTSDLSFADDTAVSGQAHAYSVRAVDFAGNRSAPTALTATFVPDDSVNTTAIVAWAMLVVAAVTGAVVAVRAFLGRRGRPGRHGRRSAGVPEVPAPVVERETAGHR